MGKKTSDISGCISFAWVFLILISVFCISGISPAAGSDLIGHADPYPDPEPPFHWLVDSQGARAAIVVGQDSSSLEDYAAQEISRYVEEITKASLPILTAPSQDYYPIYIGQAARSRLNYSEWQELGEEGFLIKNGNGVYVYGIYIAGNEDLGTLYGAYHFIERHLGVRWFMPDDIGEVVPYSYHNLRVGTFDYTEVPSFKVRWVDDDDWALRNKMNVAVDAGGEDVGVNWWRERSFHTHFELILPSVYYDDHPEWFALRNGERVRPEDGERSGKQLCTSDPNLIQEMANNIIAVFDDDPSVDVIHVSPQDGGGFCECEDCVALDGEWPEDEEWHGRWSNRLAVFHNAVADLVAEEYPDKLIITGAYAHYLRVPNYADYSCPNNVAIQVCHTYSCNNHRVALPTCQRNRTMFTEELLDWSELTDHLFIYEYYRKGAWGNLPYSQTHVIREDIPYYHSVGVEGFYTQRAGNRWPNYGLNHYIAAKLLWNVDLDVDLLMEDFYEKFYGNAAGPMKNYYERLESAFKESHTDVAPFGLEWTTFTAPKIFTAEVLADFNTAITNAEALAQTDSEVVQDRVDIIKARIELTNMFLNYLEVIRSPFEGIDLSDPDAVDDAHQQAILLGEPLSDEMIDFCQANGIPAYTRNLTAHENINFIVHRSGEVENIIDYVWDGGGEGHSWEDANNWNLGTYPDAQNTNAIIIGDGNLAVIDSQTGLISCNDVYAGHGYFAESGGGLDIQSGGTLEVAGLLNLGGSETSDFADNAVLGVSGGTLIADSIGTYGSGHVVNFSGGTIDLAGRLEMGLEADSNNTTTLNISGGTLNATHIQLGQTAGSGTNNMNMTGGTVNLTTNMNIPADGSGNIAHVQFDGGTISMGNRLWINKTSQFHGSMDMTGDAKLIIGDDWVSRINSWQSDGRLTAYGGDGEFLVDYDRRNPQQTTVTVKCPEDIPGDLKRDCRVDFADLAILCDSWLQNGDVAQQLSEDGPVDFIDFSILAEDW